MKIPLALAALALMIASAGAQDATPRAAPPARAAPPMLSAVAQDVAPARRARPRAPAPAPAPPAWRPADPSFGPGTAEFRRLQREGRCVIDLGYGRFRSCNNE